MMQKRQKDWLNISFDKRFCILQNKIWVFKKNNATLLVKPINYWEGNHLSLLICIQINLIIFVESSKFDNI